MQVSHAVDITQLVRILCTGAVSQNCNTVLESMRACEPGLQAPSNLTGSKIKNTHIFLPLLILSERYEIQYLEEHLIW